MTKVKNSKYIVVAFLILLSEIILFSNLRFFFKHEQISVTSQDQDWEMDTEMKKYRISLESDCEKIDSLKIVTDSPVSEDSVLLQTVLYSGERVETKLKKIQKKEDGSIIFKISDKLEKNVNGIAAYDFCVKKECNVHSFEAEAKLYTNDWIAFCLLMVLSFMATGYLIWNILKKDAPKSNRKLEILYLIGTAIVMFWNGEILGNEQFQDMSIFNVIKSIILMILILSLTALILNSVRNAMIICLVGWMVLNIANYFVVKFRNQPIQPQDIFSIKTAWNVRKQYQYTYSREYISTILISMIWASVILCEGKMQIIHRMKYRVIGTISAIAGLFCSFYILCATSIGSLILPDPSFWNAKEIYVENGFLLSFLSYGKSMIVKVPKGYSTDKVQMIKEKYEQQSQEQMLTNDTRPNIIVVMNEALADYRKMGEIHTSEKYFPFLDSLNRNCIKGTLYVPTYAGGTANTEYEFLTGNSISFYQGNRVPYSINKRKLKYSIAQNLKQLGYQTIAMHPNTGSNYNRSIIYPLMGFDEFYTIDDLFSDASRMRGMVSDYGDYEKMISWINHRTSNEPYFIFNVTMQNHSDYISNTIPVSVYTEDYDYQDVNEYLTLVKESDKAMEYLINEIRKMNEKTILVVFGDHYPGVNEDFVNGLLSSNKDGNSDANYCKKYEIPLLIWANYDINMQTDSDEIKMSSNYLAGYLMDLLNLPKSGYQEFLADLQKEVPILLNDRYIDEKGEQHIIEEVAELPEKLQAYYWLQYQQLYKNNKKDEFW